MKRSISRVIFSILLLIAFTNISFGQAPIGKDSATTTIKGVTRCLAGLSIPVTCAPYTQAYRSYFYLDTAAMVFCDCNTHALIYMKNGKFDTVGFSAGGGEGLNDVLSISPNTNQNINIGQASSLAPIPFGQLNLGLASDSSGRLSVSDTGQTAYVIISSNKKHPRIFVNSQSGDVNINDTTILVSYGSTDAATGIGTGSIFTADEGDDTIVISPSFITSNDTAISIGDNNNLNSGFVAKVNIQNGSLDLLNGGWNSYPADPNGYYSFGGGPATGVGLINGNIHYSIRSIGSGVGLEYQDIGTIGHQQYLYFPFPASIIKDTMPDISGKLVVNTQLADTAAAQNINKVLANGNNAFIRYNFLGSGVAFDLANGADHLDLLYNQMTFFNGSGGIAIVPATLSGSSSFEIPNVSGTAALTSQIPLGVFSCSAGDLFYGSSTNTISNLAIGTPGFALTISAGTVPVWTRPAVVGGSTFASPGIATTFTVTVPSGVTHCVAGSATPAVIIVNGCSVTGTTMTISCAAAAIGGSSITLSYTYQ